MANGRFTKRFFGGDPFKSLRLHSYQIFCLSCSCGKRVGSKLKFWKEKQLELESKFKEVYPSTSIVMSSKGKSKKTGKKSQNSQKAYTNFHLSLYAAHLTKELVVKVLALNLKKPIFGK